jgi:putative ABC transport system permease protein
VALGLAAGLAGAFVLTRLMESLLFEIRSTDFATYLATATLLGTVALAACWLPARRAARVNPMVALRTE